MGHYLRLGSLAVALAVMITATPSQAQLFGRRNDDSTVRIGQLEEQIRIMTGQMEQMAFQMRELQDQLRRMQEDNEYRFQQLEGGAPAERSQVAPGLAPDGTPQTAPLVTPGGGFATLPADGSGDGDWGQTGGYEDQNTAAADGPIDLSALARGLDNVPGATSAVTPEPEFSADDDALAGIIGSGDPRSDYDQAYSMAVNGNYTAAEAGFRTFLETYPDNDLSVNAQYWLGESLLAQQNYREAADAFLKTYRDHPGNSKSADSLLKLGVSLRGLGETDVACATFAELLNKFPEAAPAVLDQARYERQSAQCS